jgi:rhamnogalacturonyl hydrolase YesR
MRLWLPTLILVAELAHGASSFGVTVSGQPMPALPGKPGARVLVIGGLDGAEASVTAARREAEKRGVAALLHKFENPDRLLFPPPGEAYAGPGGDAHYLWRYLLQRAPDHVYIIGSSPAADRLVAALKDKIPATIVQALPKGTPPASPWRLEIERRLARTPEQVAKQLEVHYGHALEDPVYIPAMALVARLRLGALVDVEKIVAPYASGEKPSLPAKASSSHQSGHLLFGELYKLTKNPAYLKLALAAAGMGFEADGSMKEAMPMHSEMSDSFFMGCPILAQAGRLTGETKYYDMALRHFRFMQKLDLRFDGTYRHSPLDEAAWGRGNGFPALGMALTLTELPGDHPAHPEILKAFQSHLRALLRHQDDQGAWHQVIDHPESYPEYTATAMIGFALTRGLRNGWIKGTAFEVARDNAWRAVKRRTAEDGVLLDVCTGTGKQKSLRDYYDRPAIFGRDPRGGAMSLLLATELMGSN